MIKTVASRRSFLAAATAAGAIVAPNVAVAKTTSPDAELIELDKKMDAHYRRVELAKIRNRPLREEATRQFAKWLEANPTSTTPQRTQARNRVEDTLGIIPIEDLIGEIDPIARDIIAIPAATMTGLAVKARLAKCEIADFWDEPDSEADWDHLLMRKLCDAVIDMAARMPALVAGVNT